MNLKHLSGYYFKTRPISIREECEFCHETLDACARREFVWIRPLAGAVGRCRDRYRDCPGRAGKGIPVAVVLVKNEANASARQTTSGTDALLPARSVSLSMTFGYAPAH